MLRAQLGREVAKVSKTKSGQSTDELYASSWIHYDRLSFLLPVIKSSKSRDTLKHNNEEENEEVEETRLFTPGLKKQSLKGRWNYYLSALKLLLKSQSNPLTVSIQPLPST